MNTDLRQMDMGSLTGAQMWVRAVHMNGVRHKQVCTVDSEGGGGGGVAKLTLILPRQRIEPRVFGFEFRRTLTSQETSGITLLRFEAKPV